jgi:inorganic pyrophosphatase
MKDLLHLPQHKNFPQIAKAIVEIPKDSTTKYEYDPSNGLMKLDRCLISSLSYPASYGFLPGTLADDGDPVDVLIYNTVPLHPMTLVEVRVVGALLTYDHGKKDYKIMGVPLYNPNNYTDIDDLDPTFLSICEQFFRLYKKVNRKANPVKVKGWFHHKQAQDYIKSHLIECPSNLHI